GDRLTTTITFPNGYTVEGPWHVSGNRPVSLEDGTRGVAINASLDRIIEVEPGTGQRVTTPFPEPIETTFDGQNEQQLVERAAQIWCLTVIRAQQNHQRNQSQRARPGSCRCAPRSTHLPDRGPRRAQVANATIQAWPGAAGAVCSRSPF